MSTVNSYLKDAKKDQPEVLERNWKRNLLDKNVKK